MSKRIFTGRAGRTLFDTDYQYKFQNTRPKNAPNVVYILIDDMGFASLGCYGSNIETPHIDRLAAEGLRYNNFHTTAVCSATRCSLLTGANHHAAGIASLVEFQTGTNNGLGKINPQYATIAEILKEYDYSTYCAGKWHLSASQSPAGPYDGWPLAKGFDRYYGFLHGETDQYHPHLVQDNSFIEQPKSAKDGYHLSEDITNHAIDFLFQHTNAAPDRPFFLYLAYGAMHTPHHAPKEYIDRYKGKFDAGWDVIREQWFANQKKLGIVPQDAELTDRAPYVPAWDSLRADQKKVYTRLMETFAGFLTHLDNQIGRLTDYLERIGQLDNTVIVFLSDNGASAEGGKDGRAVAFSGQDITSEDNEVAFALEHLEEIGGEYSFPHYPTGWANACNTPFQWYKIWAHEGGIKDPLIIRYPKLITDRGGIRGQYHHVSDITPTILDILNVDKPENIKGIPQKPFTGTSLKYTFADAAAADRKHVQHYEVHGNRAIYKDGWKAVVNHTFSDTYEQDRWELYHVEADYSEKHDVAQQYPEKLRELQEEFFYEAGRNDVFPMLRGSMHAYPERLAEQFGPRKIPEQEITFHHIFKPYRLSESNRITLDNLSKGGVSHYITADIRRTAGDNGVLFATGDRFGGFVFYIKDNKLKFVYNDNRKVYYKAESAVELPEGELTVRYDFTMQTDNASADVTLSVNGEAVGSTKVKSFYYMKGFATSIRANLYTEISPEYEVPFEFTGDIRHLTIHSYPAEIRLTKVLEKIHHYE